MTGNDTQQYWDDRSTWVFDYRGECFYTMTPISYYYVRRTEVLQHLARVLASRPAPARVLDYGCGDGVYLHYLAQRHAAAYFGCDISRGFITRAAQRCSAQATLAVMTPGCIPFSGSFDLVYCVAVLAHITDETLLANALRDMRAHLAPTGMVVLCEATAWWRRTGRTWTRRTTADYARLLYQCGLRVCDQHRFAYPLFFWYEHTLLPLLAYLCFRGTREQRMLAANRCRRLTMLNDGIMRVARHVRVPWLTPTHTTIITATPLLQP